MIAAPDFFANLISVCAEARTCVTVPGADSTVSVHMVWIESITIRRGTGPSDKVETMSSTEVSAASCTGASASRSEERRVGKSVYLRGGARHGREVESH